MCSNCGDEYREVIAENVRAAQKHQFEPIFPARLEDADGNDILQTYLERCAALRASRDSQAIKSSNANTLLFIDALRGHL